MSADDENEIRMLWFAAAKAGRVEPLRDLLEMGADIGAVDNTNQNACYVAIKNDHIEAVEFLLARRINLTPSLLVAAVGRKSDRFAIALIDAGASIEALTVSQLVEACGKSAALLTRMLDRGVDIVALCDEGGGVLPYVMFSPHKEIAGIFRIMHRRGVNLLEPGRYGSSIHHAAMQENLPAMRVLIELGIDIDYRNPDGLTALHTTAAERGFELYVEHLLAGGADFRLLDNCGKSPLHLAARDASSFGSLCALLALAPIWIKRPTTVARRARLQLPLDVVCRATTTPTSSQRASASQRLDSTLCVDVRSRCVSACSRLALMRCKCARSCCMRADRWRDMFRFTSGGRLRRR